MFYGIFFIVGLIGEIVVFVDNKSEKVLVVKFDLNKIKVKCYSWGIFRDCCFEFYKVFLILDG